MAKKMNKVYVITHAEYGLGGVFTDKEKAEQEAKSIPCYGGFPWRVKEVELNKIYI